jgi:hypothetical protein
MQEVERLNAGLNNFFHASLNQMHIVPGQGLVEGCGTMKQSIHAGDIAGVPGQGLVEGSGVKEHAFQVLGI